MQMSSISAYKNKRQLEEALARKRDLEFRKAEECKARVKYYNNFDRANIHFQSWTNPEYYKQFAENLENAKLQKEKEKKISERRERLGKMLEIERRGLLEELRILEQGSIYRRKDKKSSEDAICEIYKQLKIDSEERRRKEVEERLYQKWRSTEGCRLLESPEFNEHQALAKMSWMDKQVLKQLEKERKIKNEMIKNQTETEQIKTELMVLFGQQKDMKYDCDQLKLQIERDMKQYQEIEKKYNLIKDDEENLKENLSKLEKLQTDYIKRNESEIHQRDVLTDDIKFHKLQLKQYSDLVINYLDYKIQVIKDLKQIASHCDKIQDVLSPTLSVLLKQYKVEIKRKQHIYVMYDSEARRVWDEFLSKWKIEEANQYEVTMEVLNVMKNDADGRFQANITAQNEYIYKKENLLKELDDTNSKIQLLEKDMESNKCHIETLKSNKVQQESKYNLLNDYLADFDKQDNNVSLKPLNNIMHSPATCTSKVSINYSTKYRDSVRDIIYDTFVPQSSFNHSARSPWKRGKDNAV